MSIFFRDDLDRFEFLAACSVPLLLQLCVFRLFLKGMPYSFGLIMKVSGVSLGLISGFLFSRLRNAGFGVAAPVFLGYIFFVLLFIGVKWSSYFLNFSFIYAYVLVLYFSFFGGRGFWGDLRGLETPLYVKVLCVLGFVALVWDSYVVVFKFHAP